MQHIFSLLSNRNIIMLLALFLGIFFGSFAESISFLSLPALAVMMVVSLVFFDIKDVFSTSKVWRYSFSAVFLNYFASGAILMLLAYVFMPNNKEILWGFLFIVFAPPGVVIVPFALLLKGNVNYAAVGSLAGNLAFIILFPLMVFFYNPGNENIFFDALKIIAYVIFFPLLISRLLRHRKTFPFIKKYRSSFVNWSFFLIIYIVIGLNHNTFKYDMDSLIKPVAVLSIFLFLISFLYTFLLKKNNEPYPLRVSKTLMFSVKNNGVSAVVSLNMMGAAAAIPSAALSIVLLFYLMAFSYLMPRTEK